MGRCNSSFLLFEGRKIMGILTNETKQLTHPLSALITLQEWTREAWPDRQQQAQGAS
jgi:hypothetical protein